jgi:nucleotide-binding universal stress UspA family protein
MFGRLLVPLDGSELAESVLPHVAELGKGCASEVVLLRVIAPPGDGARVLFQSRRQDMPVAPRPDLLDGMTPAQYPIFREQELASLEAHGQRSLTRARDYLSQGGLKVQRKVLFGRPEEQIVDYAEKEQVDLIAMATHGRSGFRRRVFGSVTEKVLRTTSLPILLITPNVAEAAARPADGEPER